MNKTCFVGFCFVLLILGSTRVLADLFVGEFYAQVGDEQYQMSIQQSPASGYEGSIDIDGNRVFEIDARRFGDKIAGRLVSVGGNQGFIAEMRAGAPLVHLEDGRSIVFRRGRAP